MYKKNESNGNGTNNKFDNETKNKTLMKHKNE